MKPYCVTIQMKPLHQYFHMVLSISYVVLTCESVDEILWCNHSNKNSLAVVWHAQIHFLGVREWSSLWHMWLLLCTLYHADQILITILALICREISSSYHALLLTVLNTIKPEIRSNHSHISIKQMDRVLIILVLGRLQECTCLYSFLYLLLEILIMNIDCSLCVLH